jgi:hypothetical protein
MKGRGRAAWNMQSGSSLSARIRVIRVISGKVLFSNHPNYSIAQWVNPDRIGLVFFQTEA